MLHSAGEGKYLQEQLLTCALYQAEGNTNALVVVLTGSTPNPLNLSA